MPERQPWEVGEYYRNVKSKKIYTCVSINGFYPKLSGWSDSVKDYVCFRPEFMTWGLYERVRKGEHYDEPPHIPSRNFTRRDVGVL